MKKIITPTDYLGIIVNDVSKEVFKYTPQIYLKNQSNRGNVDVQPIASGVLITVEGKYFLLTAGHVIEGYDVEDLGIMVGNLYNILNGNVKYVNPAFDSVADKIDIAIWELNDEVAQSLSAQYSFLSIDQVDLNHNPSLKPQYLIIGYPWRKSKKNPVSKKIKVKPFVFLTKQSKPEVYKREGYERHSNIIVEYKQRQIKEFDGNIKKGVKPEGVSGCGLWFIPKLVSLKKVPDFRLVGLVIGQDKFKRHIITTRIHIITEVLRKEFKLKIPASKLTKLNIQNK